jgi:hypothetical protein
VEQSLEWYGDTKGNLGLYAADYSALFEHTIGKVVQKVGGSFVDPEQTVVDGVVISSRNVTDWR